MAAAAFVGERKKSVTKMIGSTCPDRNASACIQIPLCQSVGESGDRRLFIQAERLLFGMSAAIFVS